MSSAAPDETISSWGGNCMSPPAIMAAIIGSRSPTAIASICPYGRKLAAVVAILRGSSASQRLNALLRSSAIHRWTISTPSSGFHVAK